MPLKRKQKVIPSPGLSVRRHVALCTITITIVMSFVGVSTQGNTREEWLTLVATRTTNARRSSGSCRVHRLCRRASSSRRSGPKSRLGSILETGEIVVGRKGGHTKVQS